MLIEARAALLRIATAALAPPAWRPLAYTGAIAFGLAAGGLRLAGGAHFFSDVMFSGVFTFLIVWLMHALIYRWPSTRLSDQRIDAAMTRMAWPAYRRLQKWRGRDVGPKPSV